MTKHFLSLRDIPNLREFIDDAVVAKTQEVTQKEWAGKSLALVFEKSSTRTRVSFQTAVFELGGQAVELNSQTSQLGRGEPLKDTARVLSGYCDGIMFRTSAHERIETMAQFSSVPVINGLTDWLHPCQLLADLMTVKEVKGSLEQKYCWLGDGNNMANSWINAAGLLGLDLSLACPEGYLPDMELVEQARVLGATISLTEDPKQAIASATVINTDVWASMGQEQEKEKRKKDFQGYCLDRDLLSSAESSAIVLHCLPAYRGLEISDDVIEGDASRVWKQAANRKHAQKHLLRWLISA